MKTINLMRALESMGAHKGDYIKHIAYYKKFGKMRRHYGVEGAGYKRITIPCGAWRTAGKAW